jgi:hypothetical protein
MLIAPSPQATRTMPGQGGTASCGRSPSAAVIAARAIRRLVMSPAERDERLIPADFLGGGRRRPRRDSGLTRTEGRGINQNITGTERPWSGISGDRSGWATSPSCLWVLRLDCRRCGHASFVTPQTLYPRRGPSHPWRWLRFRCGNCRSRDVLVRAGPATRLQEAPLPLWRREDLLEIIARGRVHLFPLHRRRCRADQPGARHHGRRGDPAASYGRRRANLGTRALSRRRHRGRRRNCV